MLTDHLNKAINVFLTIKNQRIGQAIFNVTPDDILKKVDQLSIEDKDKIDCFYNDNKCYDYLVWCYDEEAVNEVWNMYNLNQYYGKEK